MSSFFLPVAFAAEEEEDDYNFSWLDTDKKVYVLQNRKYRKAMKPHAFVGVGLNLSNSFRTGYVGTLKGGFWISEQFGVEGFFTAFTNSDNDTFRAIKARTSILPYVREIRNYEGAVVNWAPFYSKVNFFNKILYFDWMVNGGIGIVNTANDRNTASGAASSFVYESHFGLFVGTAMNFFLSRHFSVRLDLLGVNYGATGADDKPKRFTSFDFTAGIGFLL